MATSRIWHGGPPHRTARSQLSDDGLLVETERDIVGVYLDPPAHAAAFCIDATPQIQGLDRRQPLLRIEHGLIERRMHDYRRHGTRSLVALNGQTSQVNTQFHTPRAFANLLIQSTISRRTPLTPLPLSITTAPMKRRAFRTAVLTVRGFMCTTLRLQLVFQFAWQWFAELTTKQIRGRAYRTMAQLKAGCDDSPTLRVGLPTCSARKSADQISTSIARFAQRTAEARAAQTNVKDHRYGNTRSQ